MEKTQKQKFIDAITLEKENAKPITATITIPVAEYTRLKDMETRFEIFKKQAMHASYIPLPDQIILGIENEYKPKEFPAFEVK